MTQFHSIIAAIWPQPPAGLEYVEQALSGGDYISTGLFEVGSVSPSGTGRTKGNCKQVTSLFFDADLIGLHTAVRVSEGEEVEISADARKAVLYTVPDDEIEGMKEYALEVVTEALSAVSSARCTKPSSQRSIAGSQMRRRRRAWTGALRWTIRTM